VDVGVVEVEAVPGDQGRAVVSEGGGLVEQVERSHPATDPDDHARLAVERMGAEQSMGQMEPAEV